MTAPMPPERLFEIRVQRSTARACKTVEAGAVFEAVGELLAEVTRLRPMEAALTAVRELHADRIDVDLDGGRHVHCTQCCVGGQHPYDYLSPCVPCPTTRAALDGGASDGE